MKIDSRWISLSVSDFGELRLSGPYINQVNPGNWVIDVLVTTLIQIIQEDDVFKIDRAIGIFLAAYKTDIDVLKLGTGEDDDQTQLGCLRLVSTAGEKIRVDKFGQIQAANRIAQATIEARYRLTL
jgi:hypothetical protein